MHPRQLLNSCFCSSICLFILPINNKPYWTWELQPAWTNKSYLTLKLQLLGYSSCSLNLPGPSPCPTRVNGFGSCTQPGPSSCSYNLPGLSSCSYNLPGLYSCSSTSRTWCCSCGSCSIILAVSWTSSCTPQLLTFLACNSFNIGCSSGGPVNLSCHHKICYSW